MVTVGLSQGSVWNKSHGYGRAESGLSLEKGGAPEWTQEQAKDRVSIRVGVMVGFRIRGLSAPEPYSGAGATAVVGTRHSHERDGVQTRGLTP